MKFLACGRSLGLILLAVMVCASMAIGAETEWQIPEDTNTIESLTPEQARKLVATFPGVAVTDQWDGITYRHVLPLNALKKLDADLALALAGYEKGPLLLSGVTRLDTEIAAAIAGFRAKSLYLDGVSKLDIATAKAISEFKGLKLSLSGLTTLDADTARSLAQFKGKRLHLNGLTSLDAETATALAGFNGDDLHLKGLTTLDAATAKGLAGFKGTFNDELFLDGLCTLDADTAKALADFKGDGLHLKGLARLDADTAKALARFGGTTLHLMGLAALDIDTAMALAEFSGDYTFPQIIVQQFIAEHPFGKETALLHAALRRGDVACATLDGNTAKALAEFKGARLHIYGLQTIGAVAAKQLAKFKGEELVLHDLTTLDAETAKSLATYSGSLQIPDHVVGEFIWKNPLNKDTVQAYAALLRGNLRALTTLDAETAKALAEYKGDADLAISCLNTLSPAAAKALAAADAWDGDLPRLTALDSPASVEIAKALAARKGPLRLPNLKRVSPKTLTALLKKKDIELPPLDKLELIKEPDGSPTEDFVLPEGDEQQR